MALTSIRSVTVDYPDLENFVGRNPRGSYKEEEVVEALRGVFSEGGTFYFEDREQGGRRFKLSPDPENEGSWLLREEEGAS